MSFALKIGHVALFTCMKQQSMSLQIAFIFISDCDACLACSKIATDYSIYYCSENNGTSLSNELKKLCKATSGLELSILIGDVLDSGRTRIIIIEQTEVSYNKHALGTILYE